MSLIGSVLGKALGLDDDAEKMQLRPNRADYRRAGQRTPRINPRTLESGLDPATHRVARVKRARPAPHPVAELDLRQPSVAVREDAQAARLDAAFNAQQAANAGLDEAERTPWVFPWQEQAERDARAARRRQRRARRTTRQAAQ